MNTPPQISVIIPTHGRPQSLERCLESLLQQSLPVRCYEIIVVDDGSLQPLVKLITKFAKKMNLRLIRQPQQGPAAARNRGAAAARGKFLAFTDDDCRPQRDWLSNLVQQLVEQEDVMVGGRVVNALEKNWFAEASHLLVDYLTQPTPNSSSNFFPSNNIALSAEGFHTVGGFDARFPLAAGEDRALCARWAAAGFGFVYAAEAVVQHAHHLGLGSFWRQHYRYGRGARCFHGVTAAAGQKYRQPFAFYLALVTFPFGKFSACRALILAKLLALAQVATAVGYLREKFSEQ